MSDSIPILMYHQVTARPCPGFEKYCVTPDAFGAQMDHLRRARYTTLTIEDLVRLRSGNPVAACRPIVITFDDGYQDCFEFAMPILQARGQTATFFLVAGLAGKSSEWLREERSIEFPLMDWEAARRLEAAGFHCGAHGFRHRRLTDLSRADCREELVSSRRMLEDQLGREVRDMAYPYGRYDQTVRDLTQEAGFRSACSVRIGLSPSNDDPFALRRIHVSGLDSMADFFCRLRTAQAVAPFLAGTLRGAWRKIQRTAS
jgi:peptidoglycan/xylan/chitin deacetylase (PgdA/CDA1 family)